MVKRNDVQIAIEIFVFRLPSHLSRRQICVGGGSYDLSRRKNDLIRKMKSGRQICLRLTPGFSPETLAANSCANRIFRMIA